MVHHFETLNEALLFVAANGGTTPEDVPVYAQLHDYQPPFNGAFWPCYKASKLASGAYLVVEAYNNGPLSEVTPDEDFGVRVLGITEN